MAKAKWLECRERCAQLEIELEALKERPATPEETCNWLLNTGATLIGAARAIIEIHNGIQPPPETSNGSRT